MPLSTIVSDVFTLVASNVWADGSDPQGGTFPYMEFADTPASRRQAPYLLRSVARAIAQLRRASGRADNPRPMT
jgi:hypothetical protein